MYAYGIGSVRRNMRDQTMVPTRMPFGTISCDLTAAAGLRCGQWTMERRNTMQTDTDKQEKKQDKMVEQSFPASDPPSNTGIAGPGLVDKKPDVVTKQDK